MEPEQTSNESPSQTSEEVTPLPSPGQSISPDHVPTPYQETPQEPYELVQPAMPGPQQADVQFLPPSPTVPQESISALPIAPAPSSKKGKWLVIILLVVIVLAAAGVGAYLLLNKKKPQNTATTTNSGGVTHSYATSEDATLTALRHDSSVLSSSSLASMNGTDLFYATFRNAAEQPIVTTTTNSYWSTQLNGTPQSAEGVTIDDVNQAGYDYKSGQFSYQSSGSGNVDVCVNGVDYDTSTDVSLPWIKNTSGNFDCQAANTTATINDGLNTGGLSTTQAQHFVDVIRDVQSLLTVTKTSLVTEQGKSYIRFDVSVDASKDCYPNSVPSGVGCFQTAFDHLNLPKSWPYTAQATLVSGAQFAYFVDPTTQLPAYMQIAYTPVTATQGNWQNQQVEYAFGPLPTFQVVNGTINAVSMSWPVAQL